MERGPLNRLKDHLCFAVQFVGLGYAVLWPVSTPAAGDLFGASLLCKGGGGTFGLVCRLPHPLQLGIGLHVVGALCAVATILYFLARAVRSARRRRLPTVAAPAEVSLAPSAAPVAPKPRARRRPMPPPRKVVEPRTHFGLRGMPYETRCGISAVEK
jgi:hypothetical protein